MTSPLITVTRRAIVYRPLVRLSCQSCPHTHTHTRMRGLRRSGRNLRRSVIANIVDMLEYFGGNCEIINRVSFDDNSAVISLLGV